MTRGTKGFALLVLYLLLAFYLLPLFQDGGSDRGLVDLASTSSLVEHNSFDISGTESELGRKFSNVRRFNGRVYSGSPPGFAVISAPAYAIVRLVFGPLDSGNSGLVWYAMRLLLSTLPLLLLAFWLYSSDVGSFSLGVLLFATPLFAFSLLYSPVIVTSILVYLAFRVIYDFERIFAGRCFTAGGLLGLAAACDFWALIPAVTLWAGLLFTERADRRRRLVFFSAGILPFLAALAVYYYLIFGSVTEPLRAAGIAYPSLSLLYGNWLSPSRGLFAFSPVLVLAGIALFTTREVSSRRSRVKHLTIATVLAAGLFVSATEPAFAGGSLIFVTPLLLDSFFDGETDDYPDLWKGFLFSISFLLSTLPVLTYLFAPSVLKFPHNSFWQPLLFSKAAFASTFPVFFGAAGSVWTMAPVFAGLALCLYFLFRAARAPGKFLAGLLAGILLVGNYMFALDLETEKAKPFVEGTWKTLLKDKTDPGVR